MPNDNTTMPLQHLGDVRRRRCINTSRAMKILRHRAPRDTRPFRHLLACPSMASVRNIISLSRAVPCSASKTAHRVSFHPVYFTGSRQTFITWRSSARQPVSFSLTVMSTSVTQKPAQTTLDNVSYQIESTCARTESDSWPGSPSANYHIP